MFTEATPSLPVEDEVEVCSTQCRPIRSEILVRNFTSEIPPKIVLAAAESKIVSAPSSPHRFTSWE